VLGILAFNALLHLFLDAAQKKWGSGVHLFAPFSWALLRFDLFGAESLPTFLLTGAGVAFALWAWPHSRSSEIAVFPAGAARWRYPAAAGLLLAYLALPVLLLSGPELADIHSVRTLRSYEGRPGREVLFDRTNMVAAGSPEPHLETFAGEELAVVGNLPTEDGKVSLRGVFLTPDTLRVLELHEHGNWPRNELAMLGVLFILLVWVRSFWQH
jgi:hypothetical protein